MVFIIYHAHSITGAGFNKQIPKPGAISSLYSSWGAPCDGGSGWSRARFKGMATPDVLGTGNILSGVR
jgi:hypothetical protein